MEDRQRQELLPNYGKGIWTVVLEPAFQAWSKASNLHLSPSWRDIDTERQIAYYLGRRKEGRMQAYCMKCRAKKEIKNPKSIIMKNKRPATQGVCPTCGTKVFRIGK